MQSAINLALVFASFLCVNEVVKSTESKLIWGIYPQDTKNGGTSVVTDVLALLENLAIGRCFIQLSWKWLT